MRIDPAPAYVKDTGTARGRGVFAARTVRAGETVETCPVIIVDTDMGHLPAEIAHIVYGWSYLVSRQVGPQTAIPLGFGCLYNHDNPANMRYEADGPGQVLRYIAVRDISQDEELTVNYNAHGGGAESTDNAWFADKQITPIVKSGNSK